VIVYADTSALASVYLGDEGDAEWLRQIILAGPDPIVTSELTDVELLSSLMRAERERRITHSQLVAGAEAFAADTADDGPIGMLPLTRLTLDTAKECLLAANVRSLDAIHIAAARGIGASSDDDVLILTRDERQGRAAAQLGLSLHPRSAGSG